MKKLLTAVAAFVLFSAGSTCQAQETGLYQQFGLPTDLATLIKMTPTQIDAANENLLVLNYQWSEGLASVLSLEDQIETLKNGTGSPAAIGNAVGALTTQEVTTIQGLIAQVAASNTALNAILTAAQKQQLANISAAAQTASNTLNYSGDMWYANLTVGQYTVYSIEQDAGSPYPSTPATPTANAISQTFAAALVQARADRTRTRAIAARQARFVPVKK